MFGKYMNDEKDILEYLGTFPTSDAKLLMDEFIAEGIPFSLTEDASAMKTAPAYNAYVGGAGFGQGVGIAIYVRPEDGEKISAIYYKVFKITT